MERIVHTMQKDTASATKSAMASGNKADAVQKLCDALTKRVAKLEKP
jgi:hypothetical protein